MLTTYIFLKTLKFWQFLDICRPIKRLKIVSALTNETYSFFVNLMKVADDTDFYVDGNWSNVNNSNIFSTSNFSNLHMDKYSCYAKCKWTYNYRCNYIIIDGNVCYFASNTHFSGLKNGSVEYSENATLVTSNGKVTHLDFWIFTIKSPYFHRFHFSESDPYSNLCTFELADYYYDETGFNKEMLRG